MKAPLCCKDTACRHSRNFEILLQDVAICLIFINKTHLKAVWPDCVALPFDLETWNLQGQGHRQRSQWKQLIKVYLRLMCERVIDHCLSTMKLNVKNKKNLKIKKNFLI